MKNIAVFVKKRKFGMDINKRTVAFFMFLGIIMFAYSALSITNIGTEQNEATENWTYMTDVVKQIKTYSPTMSDKYYSVMFNDEYLDSLTEEYLVTEAGQIESQNLAKKETITLENGIKQFFQLFADDLIALGWLEGDFYFDSSDLSINFNSLVFSDPNIISIIWFDTDVWENQEETEGNGERYYELIHSTTNIEVTDHILSESFHENINLYSETGILFIDFDFTYISNIYLAPLEEQILVNNNKLAFHDINLNLLTVVMILLSFFVEFEEGDPWKRVYYIISVVLIVAAFAVSLYIW